MLHDRFERSFTRVRKNAKDGVVVQDPFADKSDKKLQREIQVWMAGFVCLLVAFLYLSIKRMTGPKDEIPAHVLQSGIAQVTPPLEHDPNSPSALSQPRLTSPPPIPSGRFSANTKPIASPVSHPRAQPLPQPSFSFPKHPKPAETFTKAAINQPTVAKSVESPSARDNKTRFPQPTFVPPVRATTADAEADAKAEAIGRRRAKQLAAITSGLPQKLNRIQSSIQQTSAELPVDQSSVSQKSLPKDNAFVPVTSFEAPSGLPKRPTTEGSGKSFPVQPIAVSPSVVNPIANQPKMVRPKVESSKPIKPTSLTAQTGTQTGSAKMKPLRALPTTNSLRPLSASAPSSLAKPLPVANSLSVAKPLPTIDQQVFSPATPPAPVERKLERSLPGSEKRVSKTATPTQPVSTSKQYIVEAGDSFFTIAQQQYGEGQWFRALRLANQQLIADRKGLQPGMSLSIPTTKELAQQFPDQSIQTAAQQPSEAERRIYVTQAGDTLFDIARRKTGQGSRFSEIIRQNEFSLPAQIRASDQLPANLRLVLPESTLQ